MIKTFLAQHNTVATVDGFYSWGMNNYGQLGIKGNNKHQNKPQRATLLNLFQPILFCYQWSHSIILTNEGLFSWGCSDDGQLGREIENPMEPHKIEFNFGTVHSISCGDNHSMVSSSEGIYSWGQNRYGQLGLGHLNDQFAPQKIELNVSEVKSISCGSCHTIILTSDGIFSWGDNGYGQLGLGHNHPVHKPVQMEFPSESVDSISCGANHSIILTNNGSSYSWGHNYCGQLGLGHYENQNKPQKIVFDGRINSIGCGYDFTMMMTSNGLFSWGCNTYGQLGLGHNNSNNNEPQRMKWNDDDKIEIFAVVCCTYHSIMMTSEGIFSWGCNTYGQLGQGHDKNSNCVISKVLLDSPVVDIEYRIMWEFSKNYLDWLFLVNWFLKTQKHKSFILS